jgi:hypothetical protein
MYGNGWTVPVICHFFYPVFYNGELADANTVVSRGAGFAPAPAPVQVVYKYVYMCLSELHKC